MTNAKWQEIEADQDAQWEIREHLETMLESVRKIYDTALSAYDIGLRDTSHYCVDWENEIIKALSLCVKFSEYYDEQCKTPELPTTSKKH